MNPKRTFTCFHPQCDKVCTVTIESYDEPRTPSRCIYAGFKVDFAEVHE